MVWVILLDVGKDPAQVFVAAQDNMHSNFVSELLGGVATFVGRYLESPNETEVATYGDDESPEVCMLANRLLQVDKPEEQKNPHALFGAHEEDIYGPILLVRTAFNSSTGEVSLLDLTLQEFYALVGI